MAVLPGEDAVVVAPDGVDRLPALGPCDGVLVDDDATVLRVTGDQASRGWPTHLEQAQGPAWNDQDVTVDVEPPARACDHAFPVPAPPEGSRLLGFSADPAGADRRSHRYVLVEGTGDDQWLGRMIL